MRSPRASLALARIAFVAAISLTGWGVYELANSSCVFERAQDSSPSADVQPFPWHLVCHDFKRISNICEAIR